MKLDNLKLNLETELMLNVGYPMGATNAPQCYNKLFETLGMNTIMLPVEIQKGHLPEFLDACHLLGVHYLAPTMPHKADFVPLLDDVDETSRLFRSVNAVRIDEKGSHGRGLDGKGATRAMVAGGAKLDGINALMYGAGGISGVIGYELSNLGVKHLTIANRSKEKAEIIAKIINENTPMTADVISADPAELDKAAESSELFVNCTPLGSKGYAYKHDYLGFIDRMPKTATVFDSIINPPDTETILAGKKNGLNTVPGMKMLVSQMDVIFDFLFDIQLTDEQKDICLDHMMHYLGLK